MDMDRDILLPLASAIMISCVTVSLVAFTYTFGSTWNVDYLVPLSALVAIESYFSVRIKTSMRMRIVELAIIYAVLEAADALANGGTLRQALTPHAAESTLLGAILLGAVWLSVREMAGVLSEIHKSMEPSSLVGELVRRFVAGGIFLFVAAGVTQHSLATALHLSATAPSGPLLNVLVYFLIGMLVVSYVHFQSMQQRWEIQQTRITGNLQATWLRLTAGLLVLALLLAVILPTGEVFGLTALIAAIGKALAGLGLGLLNHLPGHSSSLSLSRIFGHSHRPAPKPPLLTNHGHSVSPPNWLSAARTAVFWAVIAAGIVIMLWRMNWVALRGARRVRLRHSLFARLSRLWRRFWSRARRSVGAIMALVPRALPRRAAGSAPAGLRRFLRLNALSPEEQVRYFYLSLLRRARNRGISRSPSQTPRDFSARLSPSMGDAEQDLKALTDAFIEARYSGHSIEKERVSPIKAHWRRVRNALRARPATPRG